MTLHHLAALAGALIIGAAAHVSIAATGGYAGQGAPLQIAVAAGLIVGSVAIGAAWQARRLGVGFCLAVALLAGETFAILMTAERTVTTREATAAPLQAAARARLEADARLRKADATMAAADAAILNEASKVGCKVECRRLLEGAVESARKNRDAARAALAAVPASKSSSPLADRLGVDAWLLDLVAAALASVAANGLGASLLAFGSHGRPRPAPTALGQFPAQGRQLGVETPPPVEILPLPALPPPDALDHAAKFGREMLAPAKGKLPVILLHGAYHDWCRNRGIDPLPAREIGTALDQLFQRAGLRVETIDGIPHLAGARLRGVT